jgi:hypothetical protein
MLSSRWAWARRCSSSARTVALRWRSVMSVAMEHTA